MLMLARSVLIMEFLIIGFALLVAKDLSTTNSLYFGALIAFLAFISSGLLKYKVGWALGWLTQILLIAYGFFIPTMFILGSLFLGLWVAAIILGRKGEAAKAAQIAKVEGPDSGS
jgi:hypothetical protein